MSRRSSEDWRFVVWHATIHTWKCVLPDLNIPRCPIQVKIHVYDLVSGDLQCGPASVEHMAEEFQQTASTPNFPSNYKDYENCYWTIISPWGSRIILKFLHFKLEFCCDFIYIGKRKHFLQWGLYTVPTHKPISSPSDKHRSFWTWMITWHILSQISRFFSFCSAWSLYQVPQSDTYRSAHLKKTPDLVYFTHL